jgi:hypothetical protein
MQYQNSKDIRGIFAIAAGIRPTTSIDDFLSASRHIFWGAVHIEGE